MRLTRLHQVAAHAEDLEATRHFYQDLLGARFLALFESPGLLFFDFAGTRVLFERDAAPATLYFRVDDIDQAWREAGERGVEFLGAPHMIHRDDAGVFDNPGTEEWMVFLRDPGGNTVALASRR